MQLGRLHTFIYMIFVVTSTYSIPIIFIVDWSQFQDLPRISHTITIISLQIPSPLHTFCKPIKTKTFQNKPCLPVLFFLALATLQGLCLGQNSPQDYLNAHNSARDLVGVGPMTWDENVANFARNYVNSRLGDCNMVHSGSGQYSENLAKGSGDFTGRAAVDLWVREKANYNYGSNSCAGGQVCGHYTQVVWHNSNRLGCARGRCNNGWWFISCNYAPPGNYVGQRPY